MKKNLDEILGEVNTVNINEDKLWYAITTFSTHEHKVLDDLTFKLINNQQHGDIVDACFIPEVERTEIVEKNGQKIKKTKLVSLTPGYIYIKMKMTDDAWFTIRNSPSVSGFVGSHGKKSKPVPIPDFEMLPILKSCGRTDLLPNIEFPFHVSDIVSIINGPFKDKFGEITDINKTTQMLKLNLKLLGQEIPVEISVDDVVKK